MMNVPAWREHPRGPRHLGSLPHTLTLNQGQFAVLDVEGFPILRHWYADHPAGRQLSVVARAFLDYFVGTGGGGPAAPSEKKAGRSAHSAFRWRLISNRTFERYHLPPRLLD